MEENFIVTVDAGTKRLKITVIDKVGDGKPKIVYFNDFPSEGIEYGKIKNPARLSVALKNAISSVENYLKIKVNQVMVGHQKFDLKEIEGEGKIDIQYGKCIDSDDIDKLEQIAYDNAAGSMDTMEEIFGYEVQCYNTDDELGIGQDDIIGMMGNLLEGKYKYYCGKNTTSIVIEKAFKDAGLTNVKKVFKPFEVGRAVLSKSEMESGVALIDFGAGATSISVFSNGILRHYGAIPFGGNNVTDDIKTQCHISEDLAENIKINFGACMPGRLGNLADKTLRITERTDGSRIEITVKDLSEIITAREKEIIEAMLWEIQESGYADNLKSGIVCIGGASNMTNICAYIKELSGYSVKLGCPSRSRFGSTQKTFFSTLSGISAGLALHYMTMDTKDCVTKVKRDAGYNSEIIQETGGQNKAKQEEKERIREEKEAEKRKKKEEEKGPSLFEEFGRRFENIVVGNNNSEDNTI